MGRRNNSADFQKGDKISHIMGGVIWQAGQMLCQA
jgi:hypothetical protein